MHKKEVSWAHSAKKKRCVDMVCYGMLVYWTPTTGQDRSLELNAYEVLLRINHLIDLQITHQSLNSLIHSLTNQLLILAHLFELIYWCNFIGLKSLYLLVLAKKKKNVIPLVMANETGTAHHVTAGHLGLAECCFQESLIGSWTASQSPTWQGTLPIEGDRPVRRPSVSADFSLECSPKCEVNSL